ncbi:MAG: hypothetical protein KJ787_14765 [Gammaproteobacteria bacterium]|nr:hypothetical protein [Gammaproteobacteria bacterium]MBU1647591.1 hypothetical protein [Gammaproteobacteria bacterium]MBU1971480.1 hypothetical protein [Gammaproteobacteria bacterium]
MKMLAGLVGLLMLLAFLVPPALKLQKVALIVVILIGAAMAVYEFVETVRNKDE